MSTIHLIDGEKGGIGKSLFCRTLAEYCLSFDIPFTLIDTDRTNSDVGRVYAPNQEEQAYFSEREDNESKVDIIFESAIECPTVLVNLPAQIAPVVNNWFERNELIELGKESGVEFRKWFICTGEDDSVGLFLESLDHFGTRLPHVLVRNLGASGSQWEIGTFDKLDQIVSKYRIPVIDLPKLPPVERDYLKTNACTFADASKKLKLMSKQRISIYLKKAYSAIESTRVIVPAVKEVKSA